MKNEVGLVHPFEMKLVKTDPALVEKIAKKRGLDPEYVKDIMRHNRFTFNQFTDLTGRSIHTITNYTRQIEMIADKPSTRLQYCRPYRDVNGLGPKFIARNENSEKFLLQTLEV